MLIKMSTAFDLVVAESRFDTLTDSLDINPREEIDRCRQANCLFLRYRISAINKVSFAFIVAWMALSFTLFCTKTNENFIRLVNRLHSNKIYMEVIPSISVFFVLYATLGLFWFAYSGSLGEVKNLDLLFPFFMQLVPKIFIPLWVDANLSVAKFDVLGQCLCYFWIHSELLRTDSEQLIITHRFYNSLIFTSFLNTVALTVLISESWESHPHTGVAQLVMLFLFLPLFLSHTYIFSRIANLAWNGKKTSWILNIHYSKPTRTHLFIITALLLIPSIANFITRISISLAIYNESEYEYLVDVSLYVYLIVTLIAYGCFGIYIIAINIFSEVVEEEDIAVNKLSNNSDDDVSLAAVCDFSDFEV